MPFFPPSEWMPFIFEQGKEEDSSEGEWRRNSRKNKIK